MGLLWSGTPVIPVADRAGRGVEVLRGFVKRRPVEESGIGSIFAGEASGSVVGPQSVWNQQRAVTKGDPVNGALFEGQ